MCPPDDRGQVIIWAPGSHKKKLETVSSQCVTDIDWSDDSKRVVAVGRGSGKYGRCFDWEKGNSFGDITGHQKIPITVAFKPGRPYRIASGGEDKIVCFHEGPPFKFKRSYKVCSGSLRLHPTACCAAWLMASADGDASCLGTHQHGELRPLRS